MPPQHAPSFDDPSPLSRLNFKTLAFGMCKGGGFIFTFGDVAGEADGEVTGEGVLDDNDDEGVAVTPVGDNVSDLLLTSGTALRLFKVVKKIRWSGPELSELLRSTDIDKENSDSVSSLSLLSLDSELVRGLGRWRHGVGNGEGTGVGTGVGSSVIGDKHRY